MPHGSTNRGPSRSDAAGGPWLIARGKGWIPGLVTLAAFLALALLVLVTQNRYVGFEPGYDERQPRHHGWVSSHALAIISHATPENGFVGYALALAGPNGTVRYDYFDRYPVFFSAAMHQALSITERLSSKVYIAKQIMNLIYLATVLFAALIVDKLIRSKPAALAAAILAMSSEYLLFYKDMVHFDQPALLGMLILVYTLALYWIDGRQRLPYLGTVLAVSMGRGYASFSVLIVWLVLEGIQVLRGSYPGWRQRVDALLHLPALRACVLGLVLGLVFLTYNVGVEAARTDVPWQQTSILQSAENRLGLDPAFNTQYPDVVSWSAFLGDQLDRLVRWSIPLRKPGGELAPNLLLLGGALAVIGLQASRWDPRRRAVTILMVVPGFVWMVGIRNMSGPHDYTSLYYLGVPLAFYASVFGLLRAGRRPILAWGALLASLAVFIVANQHTQALHLELETRSDPLGRLSQFTWDMMEIRARLPDGPQVVALEQELPNAPYGLGFYLPGAIQGPTDQADFIIGSGARDRPGNLTPENRRLFLFAAEAAP